MKENLSQYVHEGLLKELYADKDSNKFKVRTAVVLSLYSWLMCYVCAEPHRGTESD